MGLFGPKVKKKSEEVTTSTGFKGDMRDFCDNPKPVERKPDKKSEVDVFMDFQKYGNEFWCCRECGTRNVNTGNKCLVCGLER